MDDDLHVNLIYKSFFNEDGFRFLADQIWQLNDDVGVSLVQGGQLRSFWCFGCGGCGKCQAYSVCLCA